MSTKVSVSTKVLVALLLIPLLIAVTAKSPDAVANTIAAVISGGARFLVWVADSLARFLEEFTKA